mgnify:CR=1 FL=1
MLRSYDAAKPLFDKGTTIVNTVNGSERIRALVNQALKELSGEFQAMYSREGRPSIPPEKLLRALLLQILYTIRSAPC